MRPAGAYGVGMTENTPSPEPIEPTTDVSVELPAKVTETHEVVETPETAGSAEPDAVTERLDVDQS